MKKHGWGKLGKNDFGEYATIMVRTGGVDFLGGGVWGPFSGSRYAEQLTAWFSVFSPSQFHIIPSGMLNSGVVEILDALGLPSSRVDEAAAKSIKCVSVAKTKDTGDKCNSFDSNSLLLEQIGTFGILQNFTRLLDSVASASRVEEVLVRHPGAVLHQLAVLRASDSIKSGLLQPQPFHLKKLYLQHQMVERWLDENW